jgi:hypothetical protein
MNQEINPADNPLAFPEDVMGPPMSEPGTAANLFSPLLSPQPVIEAPTGKRRKLVTTLTLTSRNCRWPFGDPAKSGFHYCGRLPQTGRPYCDTHDRMSYQSTSRKKPPAG